MTKIPKYRNRIYYPAGLISLILLPILCIIYLHKHKAFSKQGVIEINWWTEDWGKYSTENYKYKVHPERKFVDINLTGNDKENKIKLDFAQLAIRQLILTKDTIKAVHFHFDNNAKYWTLIKAIDICNIEKAKIYVPKDNDMWVFNIVQRPKPKIEDDFRPICGNTMLMDNLVVIKSAAEIENERIEKKKYVIETAKKYSISGMLFFIMTLMAFKQIYRKHKATTK